MRYHLPVFCIPVSMAMAMMSFRSRRHSLEKRQPKAKPSHGSPKPTTPTFQLMSLIMKNCDQMPHTRMKMMRKKASGFMHLTRNWETRGRQRVMPTPMERGTMSMMP